MAKHCDDGNCDQSAVFIAYAAYDIAGGGAVHPRLARYPAPMIRACHEHLVSEMLSDAKSAGSTMQWVVKHANG